MGVRTSISEVAPFTAMVMMEGCAVGLTIMAKTAMARGMSQFVFLFYSNALASLILLPSPFFFHRTNRPLFTFSLLSRFFFLGLTGIAIAQNFAVAGLNYSSPILACAMGNLIPAFSFILSIICRMKNLDLRSPSIQAKSMGTLISIMGTLVVLLYKGPTMRTSSNSPSRQLRLSPPLFLYSSTPEHWVLGGLLLAAASLSASVWNIIQAGTVKENPEVMTLVSFYSLFGTLQCAIVSLIAERDPSAWRLKLDMELIVIVLSAVFGSVIHACVHVWCAHLKGPVYVVMFKPLRIAIASILGVIFFGDSLHFGSVVGAFIVGMGYYGVMWGQIKEDEINEDHGDDDSLESSTYKVPLLQNKMEV